MVALRGGHHNKKKKKQLNGQHCSFGGSAVLPEGRGHVDKGVHFGPGGSSSCLQRHVCYGMPVPDATIPAGHMTQLSYTRLAQTAASNQHQLSSHLTPSPTLVLQHLHSVIR